MNDSEKSDLIEEFLNENYSDIEMISKRDISRGLYCYYLTGDSVGRMILKITDECIMDNSLNSIKSAITSRCLDAMENNPNHEVVLFNDFHIEINEL